MIAIEVKDAILVYSAILGIAGAAIWLYTEFSIYRPQRFLGHQFLWKCTICGFTFLDEQDEAIAQCPRCASYISAGDKHARFVPSRATREPTLQSIGEDQNDHARNPSRRKRPNQRRRGPRRRR
ncbi:MAG: hypothetical protein AMXMBFR84_16030 [Candidatus Hydrogenedentota bacterium]